MKRRITIHFENKHSPPGILDGSLSVEFKSPLNLLIIINALFKLKNPSAGISRRLFKTFSGSRSVHSSWWLTWTTIILNLTSRAKLKFDWYRQVQDYPNIIYGRSRGSIMKHRSSTYLQFPYEAKLAISKIMEYRQRLFIYNARRQIIAIP